MAKKSPWPFLAAALSLAALALGVREWKQVTESQRALKVNVVDGKLRLSAFSDGPFVVTHLVANPDGEGDKRTAALTPSLVITDSHGTEISLNGLRWVNILGETADPPPIESIGALFVRPENARQTNPD